MKKGIELPLLYSISMLRHPIYHWKCASCRAKAVPVWHTFARERNKKVIFCEFGHKLWAHKHFMKIRRVVIWCFQSSRITLRLDWCTMYVISTTMYDTCVPENIHSCLYIWFTTVACLVYGVWSYPCIGALVHSSTSGSTHGTERDHSYSLELRELSPGSRCLPACLTHAHTTTNGKSLKSRQFDGYQTMTSL